MISPVNSELRFLGSYTHPSSSSGIETAETMATVQAELREIYDGPLLIKEPAARFDTRAYQANLLNLNTHLGDMQ
jgi:hypothetical protein